MIFPAKPCHALLGSAVCGSTRTYRSARPTPCLLLDTHVHIYINLFIGFNLNTPEGVGNIPVSITMNGDNAICHIQRL